MPVKSWTEPPNGYQIVRQTPIGLDEKLTELGVYCPVCYTVTRDLALIHWTKPKGRDEDLIIGWEVHLEELADSVEQGCQFCSFMACRFFNDPMYTFHFSRDATEPVTGCCGVAPKGEPTDKVAEAIQHLRECAAENPGKYISLVGERFDRSDPNCNIGKIRWTAAFTDLPFEASRKLLGVRSELVMEVYATEDDPASKYVAARPVNIDLASERAIKWAKYRIDECLHQHDQCPGTSTPELPKRVIQIIDQHNLKLVSDQDPAKYTALSYCWGDARNFLTSSDTIDQRMEGFKTSELPQTLQDAVRVTLDLGLDKIWIDSLCIIQDSPQDKEQEVAKMSKYYRNSFITICAGPSKCTEGFLHTRGECEKHPGRGLGRDLLEMPFLCRNGEIGKVYFREESNYMLSDEPISERGWALQERLLSPRVLIYGSRLLWQCNTCQTSDGGVEDWSFDTRSSGHRRLQQEFAASTTGAPEGSAKDEDSLRTLSEIWHRTVQEYSFRKLTLPEDKLPAVSGIAIELAKLSGDEYVAGLWRSNLLRELLWSTYPKPGLIKPAVKRAPSWSWASLDNQITFERLPPLDATPCAEILECAVIPKSQGAPFGEILSSKLRIRAPLLEIEKPEVVKQMIEKENQVAPLRNEDKGLEFRRMMINLITGQTEEKDWETPENTFLMPLFVHGKKVDDSDEFEEDKATGACLALTKLENGTFERVGTIVTVQLVGVNIIVKERQQEVEIA